MVWCAQVCSANRGQDHTLFLPLTPPFYTVMVLKVGSQWSMRHSQGMCSFMVCLQRWRTLIFINLFDCLFELNGLNPNLINSKVGL